MLRHVFVLTPDLDVQDQFQGACKKYRDHVNSIRRRESGRKKVRSFSPGGGKPVRMSGPGSWSPNQSARRRDGEDRLDSSCLPKAFSSFGRLSPVRVVLSSTITGNLSHVVQANGNLIDNTLGHVDPLPNDGASLGELLWREGFRRILRR